MYNLAVLEKYDYNLGRALDAQRLTTWSGEGIQAAGHPTISIRP